MGICVSTAASSEIHDQVENGEENVILVQETIVSHTTVTKKLGSLDSKQGSKGLNQDAGILYQGYGVEDGEFCGVFDGHGKNGHVVSKLVRNRLPSLVLTQKNALEMQWQGNEFCHKWQEACVRAFKVMDKEVKLQENLDCSCSGTTAVVVIRQGEDLVIANLGDSRAVLGTVADTGELEAVQLTTDMKPSLPSEAERIKRCYGRVLALKDEPHIQRVWLPHEDTPGLAMSRAFGDFLLKNHGVIAIPDVSTRRLISDDQFIVLATDGVSDVLSNDQVVRIVWEADNEQEAASKVIEAANAAWKKKFPSSKIDDCTVVCLFLQKR